MQANPSHPRGPFLREARGGADIPCMHAIRLEVYRHLFTALTEEMGGALRRASYSPNIKERRDYSCALFDGGPSRGDGRPHAGAPGRPAAERGSVLDVLGGLEPGDVAAVNDPFRGGTHLPDITLVSGVWADPSPGPRGRRGRCEGVAQPGEVAPRWRTWRCARITRTWAASRRARCRWRVRSTRRACVSRRCCWCGWRAGGGRVAAAAGERAYAGGAGGRPGGAAGGALGGRGAAARAGARRGAATSPRR
jgi:hypothetical protein